MPDSHSMIRNPLQAVPLTLLLALLALALPLRGAAAQSLPTGAQRLAPESFSDVPANHWASDAVERLSILGVLTGYPDQTFAGRNPATRYELAVVAARVIDLVGGSLAELALDPAFWSDVERAGEIMSRLRRVEAAVENAASLPLAEALERRLSDVEAHLNERLGEQRFPAQRPGDAPVPRSAADTVPPLAQTGEVPAAAGRARSNGLPASGAAAPLEASAERAAGGPSADGPAGRRRPLRWWLGMAAGYPTPATLHMGIRDLWPSLHLRAGAGFDTAGAYALEIQALFPLPAARDAPVLPYLAAGPSFRGGSGASKPGVLALGGIELPLGRSLQEPGSIYLELGPEVSFGGGIGTRVVGRAGLAYQF